jgi:hypothetical protein
VESVDVGLFILEALMVVLIIGYIVINFFADLSGFLIAENISLAIIYIILLVMIVEKGGVWFFATSTIASFNAGRVSRSVITPEGEAGELAKEHVPLLSLILLIVVLSFYLGLIYYQ